jgi:hypothetical protein
MPGLEICIFEDFLGELNEQTDLDQGKRVASRKGRRDRVLAGVEGATH